MRHDEQLSEGDIPAHHPFRILKERRINCVPDSLGGPLIRRNERAPVDLTRRQRVDPLLQFRDDIADRRCWWSGAGVMHACQSFPTPLSVRTRPSVKESGYRFHCGVPAGVADTLDGHQALHSFLALCIGSSLCKASATNVYVGCSTRPWRPCAAQRVGVAPKVVHRFAPGRLRGNG
jgi:hypothetical protein